MVDEGKPNPTANAIECTAEVAPRIAARSEHGAAGRSEPRSPYTGDLQGAVPMRLFGPLGLAAIDQRHVLSVVLLGAFLLLLMAAQVVAKGHTNLFLLWNLFLAGLPIIAAWAARRATRTWWFVLVSLAWLGFFPNAPYIVTDLMHLRNSQPAYLWLDVIVYGTAAATGFYAGLVSLRWMHEAVVARLAPLWGWVFVGATAVAAGFGVYLGRFQRWNTWDILTRPGDVLAGAWSSLGEVRVLAFALLFALGILVGYAIMTLLLGAPRREPRIPSAASSPRELVIARSRARHGG